MEQNGYYLTLSDYTKSELDVMARTYNGRILLVNTNMSVVYDSYETKLGKFLVASGVAGSLRGDSFFAPDYEEKTATVVLPIAFRDKD
ncbi:MAG: hypothetical protein II553_04425, partial [Lachnospiraceae bacterium]|nr:hypothetical protein [Lachnospiraceae bacterium]